MDPFSNPDITIITENGDASMAIWRMANADRDRGEPGYEIAEKMQKSFTPERVHEIWIIVNDALKSGVLLAGMYAALKPFRSTDGKKTSIQFRSSLKVSRDNRDRLKSLDFDIDFEKPDKIEQTTK